MILVQITLQPTIHALELWHGPSLAFKIWCSISWRNSHGVILKNSDKKHTILVATSEILVVQLHQVFNTPGIDASSYTQKKGPAHFKKNNWPLLENIQTLEIEGSFDDYQSLVKFAFLDQTSTKIYIEQCK